MPDRHSSANANQRARRARLPRIDYTPSPAALVAIEARRSRHYPANNYSGILNAILREWATLTGIALPSSPKSAAQTPCRTIPIAPRAPVQLRAQRCRLRETARNFSTIRARMRPRG